MIETLLKAGVDIEARDEDGRSPLMIATIYNKNTQVIEALLKAGADGKAKYEEGKTAVDYAKTNKKIYKTGVYGKLHNMQFE